MKSVFITGTDTEIGKTVVSAMLLAKARHEGINAAVMKPVQTGCMVDGDQLIAPDLEFCLTMAEMTVDQQEKEKLCPFRFEPACSPHLAAKTKGTSISIETIAEFFAKMHTHHEALIVEGAGGILAPISEKLAMIDIMKELTLPIILVARAGLGTINHTLLTIKALRHEFLNVLGVILVHTSPEPPGEMEADNAHIIEVMGNVHIIGQVPYLKCLSNPDCTPQDFWQEIEPIVKEWTF